MYVYVYWTSDNYQQTFQAFYKMEKGVSLVVDTISAMAAAIKAEHRNSKKPIPKELDQIDALISSTLSRKSSMSADNATKLIEAWEDYLQHVMGKRSKCHQFSEINTVE